MNDTQQDANKHQAKLFCHKTKHTVAPRTTFLHDSSSRGRGSNKGTRDMHTRRHAGRRIDAGQRVVFAHLREGLDGGVHAYQRTHASANLVPPAPESHLGVLRKKGEHPASDGVAKPNRRLSFGETFNPSGKQSQCSVSMPSNLTSVEPLASQQTKRDPASQAQRRPHQPRIEHRKGRQKRSVLFGEDSISIGAET